MVHGAIARMDTHGIAGTPYGVNVSSGALITASAPFLFSTSMAEIYSSPEALVAAPCSRAGQMDS